MTAPQETPLERVVREMREADANVVGAEADEIAELGVHLSEWAAALEAARAPVMTPAERTALLIAKDTLHAQGTMQGSVHLHKQSEILAGFLARTKDAGAG